MNAVTLLRIAFVVAIVQYIAHAFLFLTEKPSHGQDEVSLIESMKSHRWNFKGFKRSYWDFYWGYGLLAILWGFVEVAFLWQMIIFAKTPSIEIKPLITILFLANIVHAILTLRYFFLIPVIFDVLVAIFLALAFIFV